MIICGFVAAGGALYALLGVVAARNINKQVKRNGYDEHATGFLFGCFWPLAIVLVGTATVLFDAPIGGSDLVK